MSRPEDEYEEVLRRALAAEADSVTPSPDGLERIRARTRGRRGWWHAWSYGWSPRWTRPAMALGGALVVVAVAAALATGPGNLLHLNGNQAGNYHHATPGSAATSLPAVPPVLPSTHTRPGSVVRPAPSTAQATSPAATGGPGGCSAATGGPTAAAGATAASTTPTPAPTVPCPTATTTQPAPTTSPTTPPPTSTGGPTTPPPTGSTPTTSSSPEPTDSGPAPTDSGADSGGATPH